MKIPETVKVGQYRYTVELQDTVTEGSQCYYGRCDPQYLRITIATDAAHDQMEETFLHECLHAIDWAYKIGLKEGQLALLSVGLMAFLKDNGLLKDAESTE